jgi:hypothetical protein
MPSVSPIGDGIPYLSFFWLNEWRNTALAS